MAGTYSESAGQDVAAVTAVRNGDTERYRELVERHERRVFAVAWSRLGDASLAEDATQEAFVRAYQRLWLLGDGAKFAGWVNTIVRRVAINFGIRHRRELNKRERWAMDNPVGLNVQTEPLYSQETLRQTLAALPDAHRECLVLFYLEGKSSAEAAAALGISETALRVRLHRARSVLRERLEERLGESLEQLRPTRPLASLVMAGILKTSPMKIAGGGIGAKMLSLLMKAPLFSLPLIGALPGTGMGWLLMRSERRNFREPDGFRPELHRRFSISFVWGFPLLMAVMMACCHFVRTAWGISTQQYALACFVILLTAISARSLVICRNAYQIGMFAYCLIIAVGLSALALDWLPPSMASLPILAATTLLVFFFKKRPARMDYSLFLRGAHGLLKLSERAGPPASTTFLNRKALLEFARFLGGRFLVGNFRWETNGLALRLAPVKNRFLRNMAGIFTPPVPARSSRLRLGWDGTVAAHCSEADAMELLTLNNRGPAEAKELERTVAQIVGQAWQEFRLGHVATAARMLGESPESTIFVVPPERSKSTRWWRIYLAIVLALLLTAILLQFWHPAWFDGLKPTQVTEGEVRTFLNATPAHPGRNRFVFNSIDLAFATCLVLPPINLYSTAGLAAMRNEVADGSGFRFGEKSFQSLQQSPWRTGSIYTAHVLRHAVLQGWIGWGDLNTSPAATAAFLRANTSLWLPSPDKWDYFLTRGESWSWVKQERFKVLRISSDTLAQIQFLREVNCLDLVNREKLIAQIASVQTLSGNPPDQPPIHDWSNVGGLFFTPGWPALQDTYLSIAALEILGGLEKMDREECIQGILRLHQSKGFFTSPNTGGFNEYRVDGSARDTIAAFESLRILGGLGRVTDLSEWKFRPQRKFALTNEADVSWPDVEAWTCQRRLEKILRQKSEHPQTKFGSLLGPDDFSRR